MELIAKVLFRCKDFTLNPGESTKGKDIAETKKRQMLSDFPDWFEVVMEAGKVETPEDRLNIETQGARPRKR